MSFAAKNIKYLRKLRDYTQQEFADKLNIKRSLLGAYEEERAEPRLDVMEKLCSQFKITIDDLLLIDLSTQTRDSYLEQRRRLKMGKDTSSSPSNLIQLVPAKAAAGYLNGYSDPEFIDELNTFTLPMLAAGTYRAFEIIGDSMMPTPSGSVIVGEKVETIDEVKSSNTYVVLSKSDGIVYKRIEKNTKQKSKLTLVSDNPLYHPYQVNTEDLLELWKAVFIIQKPSNAPIWDVNQLAGMVNTLQTQVTSLKKKMN